MLLYKDNICVLLVHCPECTVYTVNMCVYGSLVNKFLQNNNYTSGSESIEITEATYLGGFILKLSRRRGVPTLVVGLIKLRGPIF